MPKLPIFDLAAFERVPDAQARQTLDAALVEQGFLCLTGHGVDPALSQALSVASVRFFDRPEADKALYAVRSGEPYGWLGPCREALAGAGGVFDQKESFNIGPCIRPKGLDADAYRFCFARTPWPDDAMRRAGLAWHAVMSSLAMRVMRCFGLLLGPDQYRFDPFFQNPISALRVLHYPAAAVPLPGQVRAGAHTDYGTLTILRAQGSGLQVDVGGWQDVVAPDNAFIINIGDLMSIWTGGRWRSTLHRVTVPGMGRQERRLSFAFFHQPDWDAHIVGPRGEAVQSGPYLMQRFGEAVAS